VDIYKAGLVISAIVGGTLAVFCYGSYAGYDLSGTALLAIAGAASGIAFWLLYMNDYLGFPKG